MVHYEVSTCKYIGTVGDIIIYFFFAFTPPPSPPPLPSTFSPVPSICYQQHRKVLGHGQERDWPWSVDFRCNVLCDYGTYYIRVHLFAGCLAEKALAPLMPANYPFTIRINSQVLESNGMALLLSFDLGLATARLTNSRQPIQAIPYLI